MADYRSETVVSPTIPANDLTLLERLILSLVFDEAEWSDGIDFNTWIGPSQVISVGPDELRSAWQASQAVESRANAVIAEALARFDNLREQERPLDIDVDLTTPALGWPNILQDVVRRSTTLDEIVIHTAFTCSKMFADGFGGSVMRITAGGIQYASTDEMLATMRSAGAQFASDEYAADGLKHIASDEHR
jgi:hypothetical protein